MRGTRDPIEVHVNFPNLFNRKDRAKLVPDLLKSLLHQRGQIPLQYAAIEKDVAAHANTKSPHENCVLQPCSGEIKPSSREQVRAGKDLARKEKSRKRYLTHAQKFLEATNDICAELEQELLCNDYVCQVGFLFGATILSPREAFHVVLPPLPRAPVSSVESNSSTGLHLLRAMLGNEQFHTLISTRLPVSNIHVVLGCYRRPTTGTSNLKVLEKFNLTASCRKVFFILHHPDNVGQSGRPAHISKGEGEREKSESDAGGYHQQTESLWDKQIKKKERGDVERVLTEVHTEERLDLAENTCEGQEEIKCEDKKASGKEYCGEVENFNERIWMNKRKSIISNCPSNSAQSNNVPSSEAMMEMCTPAPRRQCLPIWASRTKNCETPVSMGFSTPAPKRAAPGPQACFTPAPPTPSSSRDFPHEIMNLCTPATGQMRHNSGTSRQEQLMELCTPAHPTVIQTGLSLDHTQLPLEMELATPAPLPKMILPDMGGLVETSSDIAKLTLSTPKKKKKWVLFEDQEHLQRGGVGGEHSDLVNHGSLSRDHVRKQMLPVDGQEFGGFLDGENEESSIPATGAKLENLKTNLCGFDLEVHHMQRSSACWDENIDDGASSAEEKVFLLLAGPIRGFKY